MPAISGWEVCRQIRAYSTVPVIMLTAKSADPDVVTGLSAGADDYITKPFSMLQVRARIEAVLRRANPVRDDRRPGRPIPRRDPHLLAPAEVYRARTSAPAEPLQASGATPALELPKSHAAAEPPP